MAELTHIPSRGSSVQIDETLCNGCVLCMKACPTGAIIPDRFLLDGARCLTFHNERKVEFPQWISPGWHNCLVGCLYCQKACPVNKDVIRPVKEGPAFSEKETALILQSQLQNMGLQTAIQKFENLDMAGYLPVIGRNLRALHEQLRT